MNDTFSEPIGKCCSNFSEYLVKFHGSPSDDYFVCLCSFHLNKTPFDKNILNIQKLNDKSTMRNKNYE